MCVSTNSQHVQRRSSRRRYSLFQPTSSGGRDLLSWDGLFQQTLSLYRRGVIAMTLYRSLSRDDRSQRRFSRGASLVANEPHFKEALLMRDDPYSQAFFTRGISSCQRTPFQGGIIHAGYLSFSTEIHYWSPISHNNKTQLVIRHFYKRRRRQRHGMWPRLSNQVREIESYRPLTERPPPLPMQLPSAISHHPPCKASATSPFLRVLLNGVTPASKIQFFLRLRSRAPSTTTKPVRVYNQAPTVVHFPSGTADENRQNSAAHNTMSATWCIPSTAKTYTCEYPILSTQHHHDETTPSPLLLFRPYPTVNS